MNKPEEPKFPECRVEFRGKFYSESEFEAYEASPKYKWDNFLYKLMGIMLMASIAAAFIGTIIVKICG